MSDLELHHNVCCEKSEMAGPYNGEKSLTSLVVMTKIMYVRQTYRESGYGMLCTDLQTE